MRRHRVRPLQPFPEVVTSPLGELLRSGDGFDGSGQPRQDARQMTRRALAVRDALLTSGAVMSTKGAVRWEDPVPSTER